MSSVTIKDVAKYAKVSVATVSRVINGNYYVSPDIKEKVYYAIEELQYYPNSIARSLKNDSTHTIGFIVSDISNSYFTAIARAVEDVVSEKGYNIIVCSTENKKERELDYIKLLASKKIDGLILNTTGDNNNFISNLSCNKFPIVLIDRRIDTNSFIGDFISNDNFEGSYVLTSHLLASGHRKIGIINGILSVSTGKERFQGFTKAMKEYGISINEGYSYRYDGDFTIESGYEAARKFMTMSERPTAISVMNNKMAIGVMRYLRQNNISIPEDISIVSYGDIENADILYVEPTTVALNTRIVGTKAGELLLERIAANNEVKNREVIYLPQFYKRGTTKPL